MKTRAYSYLRVSGQGQVIGDGFPRQRTAIKAYALANDIKIVREFREEGVNGSIETMNRAAWAELLALLHADGVRMILIEKLDRLARDLMVQETAIAYLQNHGFAFGVGRRTGFNGD
jgi:DNA invertase Pin-like site-specific DNA recombinase